MRNEWTTLDLRELNQEALSIVNENDGTCYMSEIKSLLIKHGAQHE